MVSNQPISNKANNDLSSYLNSLNTKKRPRHVTFEIQILAWDRHKHMAELNRLMGTQHSPLDNWVSNSIHI